MNNAEDTMEGFVGPGRHKLPDLRSGLTTKVEIYTPSGMHEGYIIANADPAGRLREVFLKGFGQEGSTTEGYMNAVAMLLSIGLQFDAELPMLCRKLAHMKFEPYGQTNHPDIPDCRSVPDFIARWLAKNYGEAELFAYLMEVK